MAAIAGFGTLFYKEILRFWKVSFQTVLTPIITALLYLTIFGHALRNHAYRFIRASNYYRVLRALAS